MTIVRVLLVLTGLGLVGYGTVELLELPPRDLLSAGIWAATLLVLHDGVFAPLCLLAGHGARRVLPAAWWPGALGGTVAALTVLILAAPLTLPRPAAANPSILDRPYGAAVAGLLAAIALATAASWAVRSLRGSAASGPGPTSDRT